MKWVEAKALYQAIEKSVIDFLFQDIFNYFGVPKEIVMNHGVKFVSKELQVVVKEYHIRHFQSSPYHPWANGHVDS